METCRILNPKQAGLYIKHGVKPIDIVYTDALVFIFERNEFYIATKHLYDNNLIFAKKCEHKLFKDEIDPTGITEIGRKLLDQSR